MRQPRIAGQARARSLYRYAFDLFAAADDPFALGQTAGMLREVGHSEEAARLHRHGIELGGRIAGPWEATFQA